QNVREARSPEAVRPYGKCRKLIENEIVAADVPSRFQAYLVMDQADGTNAFHVGVVEPPVEKACPMRSLSCFESGNIVADHSREPRRRAYVLVEAVEDLR